MSEELRAEMVRLGVDPEDWPALLHRSRSGQITSALLGQVFAAGYAAGRSSTPPPTRSPASRTEDGQAPAELPRAQLPPDLPMRGMPVMFRTPRK
jgi:hypothetical protein